MALRPAAAQEVRVQTTTPETAPAPELQVAEGAIQLPLDQAIEMAMRRNLLLIVERYTRAQAEQEILRSMGIYDLFTDAELSTSDFQQATASTLQASDFEEQQFNLGLSQLLPTGGNLSFAWDNSRQETNLIFSNLNPAYNSSAGFGSPSRCCATSAASPPSGASWWRAPTARSAPRRSSWR